MVSADDSGVSARTTTATSSTESSPLPGLQERQAGRFPALDGLRAVAALAVLVTHAGDANPGTVNVAVWHVFGVHLPVGRAIYQMNVGVEIFFVISAFLVYRPFLLAHVRRLTHPEPVRFLWKRACRIYPAYWVALFVIVAVSAEKQLPNTEIWLTHTLLVYGYDPLRWYGGNIGLRQSWTLVVEVSFYAFVPLWAWCMRGLTLVRRAPDPQVHARRAIRIELIGALLLIPIGPAILYWTALPTPLRVLPPYFGAFGGGMALAALSVAHEVGASSDRFHNLVARLGGWSWALAAAVYALFLATVRGDALDLFQTRTLVAERSMHAVVAILVVTPAVIGARNGGLVRRVLHWRPLAVLGLVSYGFYLWHYAILDWLSHHVFTHSGWSSFGAMVVVTTIGATAVGAASWLLVERPAMRLGVGAIRRPRTPRATPALRA